MKTFNTKTYDMPDSIFSVMSALSNQYKAVNLGQGFPDFDGPRSIMEDAFKAMTEGKNQYAPTQGIFSLRKAIADVIKSQYGIVRSPDTEITVTAGATEALFSTIHALLNLGDEVIVFEPFYDAYPADVLLAGGAIRCVTLRKPDFTFDFEELEQSVSDKTRAIIINNPHNPTGKVYTKEELDFIAKLAIKHDLLVISDEVYEFLTYDGAKHVPIATLDGMKDRTVTISSAGKTFSLTGWKIGWTIASPDITNAIRKIHQWTTFAVSTPAQHAIAQAFQSLDEYLPDFRKMYQYKRDLLQEAVSKTRFKPCPVKGSYFMMVEIPEPQAADGDIVIARQLVQDYGITTIPTSVFYEKSSEGATMLRLCFAKSDETLLSGAACLAKF